MNFPWHLFPLFPPSRSASYNSNLPLFTCLKVAHSPSGKSYTMYNDFEWTNIKFCCTERVRFVEMESTILPATYPSVSHGLPPPTTPSKQKRGAFTNGTCSSSRRNASPSSKTPPTTPSKAPKSTAVPSQPETPQRRKANASHQLRGIKPLLTGAQSLESIPDTLITKLGLTYTPDEWQVHLVHKILQGYDSIFCAGTGYGKSSSQSSSMVVGILLLFFCFLDLLDNDANVCRIIQVKGAFSLYLSIIFFGSSRPRISFNVSVFILILIAGSLIILLLSASTISWTTGLIISCIYFRDSGKFSSHARNIMPGGNLKSSVRADSV